MDSRKINTLSMLAGVVVLSMLLASSFVYSQSNRDVEANKQEKFLNNLLLGMDSDNPGLRNSSIFMVGKYKLEEAGHKLVERAKISNDDRVLQLIAWSLFEIGDEEHYEELQDVAKNYKSDKVKEIISYLKEIKRLEKSVTLTD